MLCPPKFYGLSKIHKNPKTNGWQVPHHINSTQDLVEQVNHITLAPGEVSALMMCLPCSPQSQ